MKKGTRYQKQFGGGGGMGMSHSKRDEHKSEEEILAERRAQRRRKKQAEGERLDAVFGYERYDHKSPEPSRRGWLFNILPTVSVKEGMLMSTLMLILSWFFRDEIQFMKSNPCLPYDSTADSDEFAGNDDD